jgi:hypothetical protein
MPSAGQIDPSGFAQGIYLLIGCMGAVILVCLGGLATWVTVRILQRRASVRQAEEQRRQERLDPDGRPYPPAAEGLCDRCGGAFQKVYYMPSGRRLCPDCYQQEAGPGHERQADN